jgi:hypothetical protein
MYGKAVKKIAMPRLLDVSLFYGTKYSSSLCSTDMYNSIYGGVKHIYPNSVNVKLYS